MTCLRNHFGSETTIIPSSTAVLSNIPASEDASVNHEDHTIINIDALDVKIQFISIKSFLDSERSESESSCSLGKSKVKYYHALGKNPKK